jgi:hypothetical protein
MTVRADLHACIWDIVELTTKTTFVPGHGSCSRT